MREFAKDAVHDTDLPGSTLLVDIAVECVDRPTNPNCIGLCSGHKLSDPFLAANMPLNRCPEKGLVHDFRKLFHRTSAGGVAHGIETVNSNCSGFQVASEENCGWQEPALTDVVDDARLNRSKSNANGIRHVAAPRTHISCADGKQTLLVPASFRSLVDHERHRFPEGVDR